ncbi:DUF6759 domain-containing protein [Frigoriflavimonas asaccharolytica]|uniref:DUF6759 domain-containing protein n=1 Tax=Frigoriflavimonas asaccharolytica TaxID=2735899 RepID=A0A8J8G953_9FLAO|nr:DUF6759 domain-containing protein [Frigoriflavimonas asaccharolytica]NRS93624.1 hypothetical protein [Frigoriflavimonas asaccharolytica]
MKKISFLVLFFTISYSLQSCKTESNSKYAHILETKDISLIENYLQNSKKNDPKWAILKSRVIALRNAELEQKTIKARQFIAKPTFTDIPKNFSKNPTSSESEEFKKLMTENTSSEHQKKTVKLLNAMFDQDITSKETILMIQNKSDCNMILRIEGNSFYNLAIPSKGENTLVLPKGDYKLSSNVCDVKYVSTKKINKNMMVTLGNPTIVDKAGIKNSAYKSQR